MENQEEPAKRVYMREWKRKKYAENPEAMLAKSNFYRHKAKFNLTDEDVNKYGDLLPNIYKARLHLDRLKLANPELYRSFLDSLA